MGEAKPKYPQLTDEEWKEVEYLMRKTEHGVPKSCPRPCHWIELNAKRKQCLECGAEEYRSDY